MIMTTINTISETNLSINPLGSIGNYSSKIITSNIKLIPNVGNVIPYSNIMEQLFGCTINDIPRMELLNKGYIVNGYENDSEVYFILSKFNDYLSLCAKRINFKNNCICPINFYYCNSLLTDIKIEESDTYKCIFTLLNDFKIFITKKNDVQSKIIIKHFWNEMFRGIVTSYNDNPFMMTLKFQKKTGYPFIINITENSGNFKNMLSLSSSDNIREDEFDRVYNSWCQDMLMENADTYVMHCLEEITGSSDLARFITESHNNKSKFVINIDDLNNIINFKSDKKMKEYIELFKTIYATSCIFNIENDNITLNFEGFNKYLLNLETSFLLTFEDKESVNTLYYNVMDELVNSYKKLYSYSLF
jgi:hypothetical protein